MKRALPPSREGVGDAESEAARQRLAEEEERLLRVGDDLVQRLPGTWKTRLIRRSVPGRPLELELYQRRHVLDLFVDREQVAVRMHGDDEGSVWVQGAVADDAEVLTIASCVDVMLSRLSVDGLEVGGRYRVRTDTQGLRAGSVLRFVRFDDVDNHYGRLEFENERGALIVVEGDFANERSLVAQVHRYLVQVD